MRRLRLEAIARRVVAGAGRGQAAAALPEVPGRLAGAFGLRHLWHGADGCPLARQFASGVVGRLDLSVLLNRV